MSGNSRQVSDQTRRILLADVARAAGVSIATASRALSGSPGVSDTQRERIRKLADELHYEHNPIGQSLRSGKTNLIGVWVESIANASSGRLVTALTDELHSHGYDILVTEYSDDPAEDTSRIRALARRRPDFMVVLHPRRPQTFEALAERGQQVIMISSGGPSSWRGPLVSVDTLASREELARHLAELGHSRLLVLQPARRIGRPGSDALKRAAERASLPLEVEVLAFAGDDQGPGLHPSDIIEMVRAEGGPTFVHVNEAQAPALLKAFAEAGITIPGDVSFMTTGAPSWAEIASPPLSVTDVDYYQCGVKAAELILALARGQRPRRRTVEGRYIRRDSVGPARTSARRRRAG